MFIKILRFLISIHEFLLLLLLMTIAFLILLSNESPQIRSLQGSISDALAFVHYPRVWITDLSGLIKENKELKAENLRLSLMNAALKEAYLENQRLRNLIQFQDTSHLDLIPAEVINQGVTPLFNSVLINVGKKEGVEPNQAVITANGIVGKTVAVGQYNTIVQIFLDPQFRLGVKFQSSRVFGIMQWYPDGYGAVYEIPKNVIIYPGEKVLTSGYSEIYPPNILVGEVLEVSPAPSGLFQIAKIKPNVTVSNLEEVFVVRNRRWFVKPS